MSTERTPDGDAYHATITQVADGDAPSGTNLNLAAEDLGDNIAWLKRRCLWVPDPDQEGVCLLPVPMQIPLENTASRFQMTADYKWGQHSTATAGKLSMAIGLPAHSASGGQRIYCYGGIMYGRGGVGAGHGSTLPTVQPTLTLFAVDPVTGVVTSLGSQQVASLTAAAYDAGFTAEPEPVNPVDVSGQTLVAIVLGESDPHGVADTTVIFGVCFKLGVKP